MDTPNSGYQMCDFSVTAGRGNVAPAETATAACSAPAVMSMSGIASGQGDAVRRRFDSARQALHTNRQELVDAVAAGSRWPWQRLSATPHLLHPSAQLEEMRHSHRDGQAPLAESCSHAAPATFSRTPTSCTC